jgi:hypothetical protein
MVHSVNLANLLLFSLIDLIDINFFTISKIFNNFAACNNIKRYGNEKSEYKNE